MYVDALVVRRDAAHLRAAPDRHAQLLDPSEQQPLDVVLEQRERVGMARGQAVQLEHRAAERDRVHRLAVGEEPVGDAALIEQLDRAGVESAPTSAHQTL